jgi:MATE family multidrug resistance protein
MTPETQHHRFSPAAFFHMALPMIISRAGLAAMGIADGVMVSRFEARSFAWLSLADGTLGRLLDVCIAFFIGGLSLAPRHFAQGDAQGARSIWKRTIPLALGLGIVGFAVGLFGAPLLKMIGQKPELAAGAAPVMAILGAGYPAALLAICAAVYLEGINRPRLVAASVVGANILNVMFNWLFIYGRFGLPAMGARGSALSTTVVRFILGAALVAVAWRARGEKSGAPSELQLAELHISRRSQWRLGMGAAGSVAVMVVLGSSLTVFAGWLGLLSLASFSASWSLAAPMALVALGMADACGIFVAAEAGRGANVRHQGEDSITAIANDAAERSGDDVAPCSIPGVASVAWSGLLLTLAPVAIVAVLLATFAETFARLYTRDPDLQASMTAALPLVCLILVVDSVGFVMVASLRGMRQVAWPAAIEIGAMLLVVPLAAEFAFGRAFGESGLGVRGLFLAMLTAGLVRAGLLAARLVWSTRGVLNASSALARAGV